jgi:hypothetical protein
MSKTTNTNSKDIFDVYRVSFEKIKGHVEKVTPQYLQSFTNLQQEYFGIWSNLVNSTLSIQQHYADKTGINTDATEPVARVVRDSTEEIIKAFDVQNKIAQTVLDATRQNLRIVSENATAFSELNQNIFNSWLSTWTRN